MLTTLDALPELVERAAQSVRNRRLLDAIAREIYGKVKSLSGQRSLDWHEEEHPRNADGEFAPKGEGETHHAERTQGTGGEGRGGGLPAGKQLGKVARTPHAGTSPRADEGTGKRFRGLFDDPDGGRAGSGEPPDSGRDGATAGERTGDPGTAAAGGERSAGPDRGPAEPVRPAPRKPRRVERRLTDTSWRYPDLDFLHGVGLKTKFRNNLEAIKTLRAIEEEGRPATVDEQRTLAKFTGWGQFPGLFKKHPADDWRKEQEQLKNLLSDAEYEAAKDASDEDDSAAYVTARKATLNSHFTAPKIVAAHWKMAQRLGFKGGRYLDPSVGSGYYLGMMPPDLRGNTSVTGIETDKTTAGIAKHLYPDATIKNTGFEKYQAPDGFYDLVASNVPFGDYTLNESRYNKFRAPIHDHFFLKSIDKTQPGGLIMHVTSTGTMDKKNTKIREEMAKHCDLISAIRMPGKTHSDAANTDVVTDLIILRKRTAAGEAPAETPAEVKIPSPGFTGVLTDSLGRVYHFVNGKRVAANHWLETTEVPDPGGGEPIEVNRYFAERPEQILGTLDRTGEMYRGDSKNVSPPADFDAALEAAIQRLPEGLYHADEWRPEEDDEQPPEDDVKDGQYVIQDGELWQREGGALVKRKADGKDIARIGAVDGVRQSLRTLINQDLAGESSDETRKALNTGYDKFVAEYGPLHSPANLKALGDDPDKPLMLSLEKWDAKAKTAVKADIFSRNTIRPGKAATSAENVPEALGICLNEHGRVDVEHMAGLVHKSIEDVEDELSRAGLAFEDPEKGWVQRAAYLSGNVRQKLEIARAAAENDPRYSPNVRALEAAQPEDIDHTEISSKLGSPWVPKEDMADFMAHLLNGKRDEFHIEYVEQTGQWVAGFKAHALRRYERSQAVGAWSTKDKSFLTLLDAALNNKAPTVYRDAKGPDGNDIRTVDAQATEDARGKMQDMRDEFADWLWSDADRRDRLFRHYNDHFNNVVPTEYDGRHLTFPGMTSDFKLRDVQKNSVWQIISRGKGVVAHEVGVGKTATMVASAMELRRLGLAKKPAIACLKSNLEQLTREAQELYPGARILSTSGEFDAKGRKEMVSRIATGDYDMVFLSHDHLNMLPMSRDVQARYIREEVEELAAAIEGAKETDQTKDKRTVKQLEKRKLQLEATLNEALSKKKDDAVTFEETGIDFLMVDECFPGRTQVMTDLGAMRIDQIVKGRLRVKVLSRNRATDKLEFRPVVSWFDRPLRNHLVRVIHEHGSFVCTPNHNIWTEEDGYVQAGLLESRHTLRDRSDRMKANNPMADAAGRRGTAADPARTSGSASRSRKPALSAARRSASCGKRFEVNWARAQRGGFDP